MEGLPVRLRVRLHLSRSRLRRPAARSEVHRRRSDARERLDTEFVHARAPIPAIGFIGRGYVAPNISITGEFSFFKLPDSIDEDYKAKYYDFDLYGTVNFTDHFGAQGGYRSFDVFYHVDEDEGDLRLRGLYFGGVVRF